MKNKFFKRMTSTLRGKLSLWYLLSVGLIILLFLVSTGFLFGITLRDQIDHHIHIVMNEATQIIRQFDGEQRDELIKNLVSTKGMTVVVLSPDGSPVLETNSPDVVPATEHQLQKILISSSIYEFSPVYFTENRVRFAASPIEIDAGKGIIAVGYSIQILYATFIKMLGLVAGTIILLVLPITLIGYKFLKSQLQPLESIANQASKVSNTPTLSKRIHIYSPTQELMAIQNALNSMLEKLEDIFKTEREFFSDAAHTLKTPLAVLRSQIENISFSKNKKTNLLSTIDTTNDTIQDLLFLSKIKDRKQNISIFSLTKLMTNLFELASSLGENNNLVVSSNIKENISIKADQKLFQRALSNIVHNAVCYNRVNGSIHLGLSKTKRYINITVKDSGVGINKKDQEKIFARFFKGSSNNMSSSGLGLSISKAVIESFRGKILLNSKPNQGTTVIVKLPIVLLQ